MGQNQKMMLTSLRKLFKCHGEFCASQPWEVIVATITFLVCVLTVLNRNFTHLLPYHLESAVDDESCPENAFNCGLSYNTQVSTRQGGHIRQIVAIWVMSWAIIIKFGLLLSRKRSNRLV
jgi:hypothetical protein